MNSTTISKEQQFEQKVAQVKEQIKTWSPAKLASVKAEMIRHGYTDVSDENLARNFALYTKDAGGKVIMSLLIVALSIAGIIWILL